MCHSRPVDPFSIAPAQIMHDIQANILKSRVEDKDQESIQSSTIPDPGYQWECDKYTRKHHIQKSQEVSPFTAGDLRLQDTDKTIWQRQTKNNKKIDQLNETCVTPSKTVSLGFQD